MKNTKITSVNSKTAPAIFKYLAEQHFLECSEIFDFGCGKYFDKTMNFCFKEGAARYTPYDLYWEIGGIPLEGKFDTVVCANVLNVIEDSFERFLTLCILKDLCKDGGLVAIQLYEGKRNNIPEETTKGYQMNCKINWYYQDICTVFHESHWEIIKHRNFYIIKYIMPWD